MALAALTLLVLPSSPLASTGAAADRTVDPSCGSPLGAEAQDSFNWSVPTDGDPEHAAVDAIRMPGGQRSPEVMVSAWGHLVLVAEVKVDQGTNFTWAIIARVHSNVTGWNSNAIWLSSPDTSQYYPQGAHVRPAAVFLNDRVWVVWDAQGSEMGGPFDRFIVMRSFDRNLVADSIRIASSSDPNETVQHAALIVAGSGLALAYSTSDGDTAPGDTHIELRTFDGVDFGAAARVSNLSDGAGDMLPAAAADSAGRLYVAWLAANSTGQSAALMFAWRDGSTWQAPQELAPLGNTGASGPAIAVFSGSAYIAYSTSYLLDLSGTDSEIRWFVFEPGSGNFLGPVTVNPEPTVGADAVPTLTVTKRGLAVGWATTEDFVYSHSSDTDPVFRLFDGTSFGPVTELSADDDNADDGAPFFVEMGEHLYAHWMLTPPQMPGDPRGNSREVVRLVSRPAQWYDGLALDYRFEEVSDNGSARIALYGGSVPLGGHDLAVRLPDGSLYPLTGNGGWVPVNPSTPDFQVLACGVPVPVRPLQGDPPPGSFMSPMLLIALLVVPALVAMLLVVRSMRRGPKAP